MKLQRLVLFQKLVRQMKRIVSQDDKLSGSNEERPLAIEHTHDVAAVKVIQHFNPQDSASELANAILVNFIDLPKYFFWKRRCYYQ